MKNYKLILYILTIVCSLSLHAQNILFPDPNFKEALITRNIVDSNQDGEVSFTEAERVIIFNVDNSGITDLTGIEHFTNLVRFSADRNQIASVDLSQNRMLTTISLSSNRLVSIDVSQQALLNTLVLSNNQITSIDVSNNLELKVLGLSSNSLTDIDVTNNTELERLLLSLNNLSVIDVSSNLKLEILLLLSNNLDFIDVSQNIELTTLEVGDNNLDCINIEENINLRRLDLRQNNFVTLTIDSPTIEILDFRDNLNLTSAYIQGPQFQVAPFFGLSFPRCLQLESICVDQQYVQLVEDLITQPNYNADAVISSNCAPPTTTPCEFVVDIPPGPITVLYCTQPSFTTYNLFWSSISNIDGYELQVIIGDGTFNSTTYELPALQNTFTLNSLFGISWRVRPVINGEGIWSEWVRGCFSPIFRNNEIASKNSNNNSPVFNNVSMYPNPVKRGNILTIEKGNESESITVFNLNGKVVYRSKDNMNQIHTGNLSPGMYLVKIQSSDNVITKNLIVN